MPGADLERGAGVERLLGHHETDVQAVEARLVPQRADRGAAERGGRHHDDLAVGEVRVDREGREVDVEVAQRGAERHDQRSLRPVPRPRRLEHVDLLRREPRRLAGRGDERADLALDQAARRRIVAIEAGEQAAHGAGIVAPRRGDRHEVHRIVVEHGLEVELLVGRGGAGTGHEGHEAVAHGVRREMAAEQRVAGEGLVEVGPRGAGPVLGEVGREAGGAAQRQALDEPRRVEQPAAEEQPGAGREQREVEADAHRPVERRERVVAVEAAVGDAPELAQRGGVGVEPGQHRAQVGVGDVAREALALLEPVEMRPARALAQMDAPQLARRGGVRGLDQADEAAAVAAQVLAREGREQRAAQAAAVALADHVAARAGPAARPALNQHAVAGEHAGDLDHADRRPGGEQQLAQQRLRLGAERAWRRAARRRRDQEVGEPAQRLGAMAAHQVEQRRALIALRQAEQQAEASPADRERELQGRGARRRHAQHREEGAAGLAGRGLEAQAAHRQRWVAVAEAGLAQRLQGPWRPAADQQQIAVEQRRAVGAQHVDLALPHGRRLLPGAAAGRPRRDRGRHRRACRRGRRGDLGLREEVDHAGEGAAEARAGAAPGRRAAGREDAAQDAERIGLAHAVEQLVQALRGGGAALAARQAAERAAGAVAQLDLLECLGRRRIAQQDDQRPAAILELDHAALQHLRPDARAAHVDVTGIGEGAGSAAPDHHVAEEPNLSVCRACCHRSATKRERPGAKGEGRDRGRPRPWRIRRSRRRRSGRPRPPRRRRWRASRCRRCRDRWSRRTRCRAPGRSDPRARRCRCR